MEKVSLKNLVGELKSLHEIKKDFVVTPDRLIMKNNQLHVKVSGHNYNVPFAVNDVAHDQISDKLGITKSYYSKMRRTLPNLVDTNVNAWLEHEKALNKRAFLIRTYDGDNKKIARAFLSDKFKVIDNYQILIMMLETVREYMDKSKHRIEIESCSITDKRIYVRFVCPDIVRDAREMIGRYKDPVSGNVDHRVFAGFVMSNSEVGQGSFILAPRLIVGACSNGMTFYDEKFQRKHLGAKLDKGLVDWSLNTKAKNKELTMLQIEDVIKTFASPDFLGQTLSTVMEAGKRKLINPKNCVINACKDIGIREVEADNVLDYFIGQGETSNAFSVAQAITYYAQHDAPADSAFKLECDSVSVIKNMPKYDWAPLS